MKEGWIHSGQITHSRHQKGQILYLLWGKCPERTHTGHKNISELPCKGATLKKGINYSTNSQYLKLKMKTSSLQQIDEIFNRSDVLDGFKLKWDMERISHCVQNFRCNIIHYLLVCSTCDLLWVLQSIPCTLNTRHLKQRRKRKS